MLSKFSINEISNIYDNWRVINYAGTKNRTARWSVECLKCGYIAIISGRDLRKGIQPRHKCLRICRECQKPDTDVEFCNRQFGNICKGCRKLYVESWRAKNKDHISQYLTKWHRKNPDNIKRHRASRRIVIQQSPYEFLKELWGCKLRTIRRSISRDRNTRPCRRPEAYKILVNLAYLYDLWDKQNGMCSVSGLTMTYEYNNSRSVSIDRIDSNKGYEPGNIQLVCQWVNLAKNVHNNAVIISIIKELRMNKNDSQFEILKSISEHLFKVHNIYNSAINFNNVHNYILEVEYDKVHVICDDNIITVGWNQKCNESIFKTRLDEAKQYMIQGPNGGWSYHSLHQWYLANFDIDELVSYIRWGLWWNGHDYENISQCKAWLYPENIGE